jgi:hypothetical protein
VVPDRAHMEVAWPATLDFTAAWEKHVATTALGGAKR